MIFTAILAAVCYSIARQLYDNRAAIVRALEDGQ